MRKDKKSWRDIEEAIRRTPKAEPPPADAFWEDFRARARLHPQQEVTPAPSMRRRWMWPGLGVAGAAALLLVALVVNPFHGSVAAMTEINSVEVVASHSGVLIMEDVPSESTILWIVDMEVEGQNGENHS